MLTHVCNWSQGDIDEALATVKKGFELDKGDTENPVLLATQTELNLLLNYKKIEAIIKEVNGFIDQVSHAVLFLFFCCVTCNCV